MGYRRTRWTGRGSPEVSSPSFCPRSGVLMSAVRHLARVLPWMADSGQRGWRSHCVRRACATLNLCNNLPSPCLRYVIETTRLGYSLGVCCGAARNRVMQMVGGKRLGTKL